MNYLNEYNDYWSRQDRWGSHSFNDPEALFQRISLISGRGSVLDVGCGMGLLVRTFLQHGVEVRGVDIAPRPIEENNRTNPGYFQLGSILDLPFPDGSWDTVVSTDCLEHIAETDVPRALQELRRVARHNIFVCLATTRDRDGRWRLTIRNREWWEAQFFAAGFRRHPLDQALTPYAARESDSWQITMAFEKIPAEALAKYPLITLEAERDLHNDMTRLSGRRSDAHLARYILARRYLPKDGLVLDAACGLGYGSAVLACNNPAVQIVGLDCSDFAVAYGNANFCPAYPTIRFQTGDVCDLSAFADGSVGLVVSFETVEHLREPEKFLAEVRRILKPDGNFICSVPNMWVDENGKDPNPWHFHVFDFAKITDLCGRFLAVRDVFNQTAGGGMKLNRAPRRIRRVNLPMTQGNDEAEWWLVAASREKISAAPVQSEAPANTVLVLTHDAQHPLYTSWLEQCPYPVVFETSTGINFAIPDHVGLVVAADCYREPRASLLCQAVERGIPTLLLADGILEYRNTFEHPQLAPGAIFQPVLAHKVACLGRSQARILESWGNFAQCEITGSARFDRYATMSRRVRPADEPFRVLVTTAITPFFTPVQHERVRQSLLDLKVFFVSHPFVAGVPLHVEWRITQGLQREIDVANVLTDLSGRELAEVLQKVDAVISTPSTAMLEAMLLGLPVAVLDYTNCPHYVQPAWRITATEHILPTVNELVLPPAPKLLFQETTLHDALECASPAAPRLLQLAAEMIRLGQQARAAGEPLKLPTRLLPVEGGEAVVAENRFDLPALYPEHAPFREHNLHTLQVEVGQLRAYAAQLEQGGGVVRPVGAGDTEKLRDHTQLTIQWRSKLEAALILSGLKQSKAAVDMMIQSLRTVESCRLPEVTLEALLEVCTHLGRHDAAKTRVLLEAALNLARRFSRPDAIQRVTQMLGKLPPVLPKRTA